MEQGQDEYAYKKKPVYGIQGGQGSFNHQAILVYLKKHNIEDYEIQYLFTSEGVLSALFREEIDFGQFAVQNSLGGEVTESVEALKKYHPRTIEEFGIPIRHFLMKRKDVPESELRSAMAHEQVFAQCKNSMATRHASLVQVTGEGDLRDTARAAEALALGEFPKTIAILGPGILADIYGFDIIDSNLHDKESNVSIFRVVER